MTAGPPFSPPEQSGLSSCYLPEPNPSVCLPTILPRLTSNTSSFTHSFCVHNSSIVNKRTMVCTRAQTRAMEQTQAQPSSSNLKSSPEQSSPEQSSPPAPAVCLTNADEAPNPVASLSEEDNVSETEHSAVLSRKEEHAHGVQEMERLVNAGGQRWVIDFQEIGERFGRFAMRVVGWMCNWVIADVGTISRKEMNIVIGALKGYCVQEDWTVLQGLLPPRRSLADHFAEALIHKAIMENVFSNSF